MICRDTLPRLALVVLWLGFVDPEPSLLAQPGLLEGGGEHALAVHADGTAWAWGDNRRGQLGDGSFDSRNFAAPVLGGDGAPLEAIWQVAAGISHSAALDVEGRVWTWGGNDAGQLGHGEPSEDRPVPGLVVTEEDSPLDDIVSIVAGADNFFVALDSSNRVWAWGEGADGQVGDGALRNRACAVQVVDWSYAPLQDVVAVAAGHRHGLALRADGSLWAWGDDDDGQLGDDGSVVDVAPRAIRVHRNGGEPLEEVRQIAAARDTSYAVDREGTLWVWGRNRDGELGDGTRVDRLQAIPVSLPFTEPITRIEAGMSHALALTESGTLWAWGSNGGEQLGGYDEPTLFYSTVPIPSLDANGEPLEGLRTIAAASDSSFAISDSTTVLSWGVTSRGQLGRPFQDMSEDFRPLPVTRDDGTSLTLETPIYDPILTIVKLGEADGIVEVAPGSLRCDLGCRETSASFAPETTLTLDAADTTGSDFDGFSGAICVGASPCTFVLDRDRTVRATFVVENPLRLVSSVPTDGRVAVDPTTSIALRFDRAALPGPAIDQVLLRETSTDAVVGLTWSQDPQQPDRLIFEPTAPLADATEYELTWPAEAVVDDEDAPLEVDGSLRFTTRPAHSTLTLAIHRDRLVEETSHTGWVWLEEATSVARTIQLVVEPDGALIVPEVVHLVPGDVGTSFELTVTAVTDDRAVRLEAREVDAGFVSRDLQIHALDRVEGEAFRFVECRLLGQLFGWGDYDEIFESGETWLFETHLENTTINPLLQTLVTPEPVDLEPELLHDPQWIGVPDLSPHATYPAQEPVRFDEDTPSSTYHVRLTGTSSGGGFVDFCTFPVVNTEPIDYDIARNFLPQQGPFIAGGTMTVRYEPYLSTSQTGERPPGMFLWMENADGDLVWQRSTWADVWNPSWIYDSTIPLPNEPGIYTLHAEINPESDGVPESNRANNLAIPFDFEVRRANEPPAFEPQAEPVVVEVLQELSLLLYFSDADGDTLSFELVEGPNNAVLETHGDHTARLRWTPSLDQAPDPERQISIEADDGYGGEALASFSIAVTYTVDLGVEVVPLADLSPGFPTRLEVVLSNHAPTPLTGAGVELTESLGLGEMTWTCEPDPGDACTAAGAGPLVDGAVSLRGGGSVRYTIDALVDPDAPASFPVIACSNLPPAPSDPEPANDCATLTMEPIEPGTDLSILSAALDRAWGSPGDSATLGLTMVNRGVLAAEELSLTLESSALSWSDCTPSPDGLQTCPLAPLEPGETRIVVLSGAVEPSAPPALHPITFSLSSATLEAHPGDEDGEVWIEVVEEGAVLFWDGFESGTTDLWND